MDYTNHLESFCECNGKEYTLESSLDDPNVSITGKIKISEANIVGYITFKRLLELDEKVHTGHILKNGLKPAMIDKKWEHLYAVKLEGGGDIPNKTMMVLCDHDFLLEKVTRTVVIPLQLNAAGLTSLSKEVNSYAKEVTQRERDKKFTTLANQLMSIEPGLTYEDALARLTGGVAE